MGCKYLTAFASVLLITISGAAQTASSNSQPLYRVDVIQRTIDAVDYQYKADPTQVDLKGTVLLPEAKGSAMVQSKSGRTEIDVRFDRLAAPSRFGREYLTYVLWAITPEGRPHNLGEVITGSSDKAKEKVTTDLQAFGLLVTAEPYAAVRQPSGVVVLENQIRPDTVGKAMPVQVHYELMAPGHYTYDVPANMSAPTGPMVSMDEYTATLELYQAQNAVQIARARGAEQYAPEVFRKADDELLAAQRLHDEKADKNAVVTAARTAYQTAEDARVLAEKRKQDADAANAQARIEQERQLRMAAEATANAAQAQASADRMVLDQQRSALQLAQSQAQAAQAAQVEAEQQAAQAQQTARQQPVVVVAPPPPPPPVQTEPMGQAPAVNSRDNSSQRELRVNLLSQLRGVLEARDTPRGLVVTVPDSDFHGTALNGYVAGPLARIASVISAQPGLSVEVDGNSDSAGAEGMRLSEERAEAVRSALVRGGSMASSVRARGLGNASPLGPNNTAQAREQNRRVEIVISGDAIGSLATWDKSYTIK